MFMHSLIYLKFQKGHTLLVPKTFSKYIFETDEETMKHIGVALPKVANAIKTHFTLTA